MKPDRQKHSTKPARQKLLKLCHNPEFKRRVGEVKENWRICTLAGYWYEANKFWLDLSVAKRNELKQELVALCQDYDLPPAMWNELLDLVVCFDLDKVTENDINALGLHPFMPSRIRITSKENGRLYLDVTFATWQDVRETWEEVERWQKTVRPFLIEQGTLPDLLEDIKPGRPSISGDICREATRLKDEEGWTYIKIAQHFHFPIQEDAYGKRTQSRTAQEAVKRGRQLRRTNLHT